MAVPLRKLGAAVTAVSLLSATSAGIAVPPLAAAVEHVSTALSVLSSRSPGVRAAGAYSVKGKYHVDTPPPPSKPDAASVFDFSLPPAPVPEAAPLPPDLPLVDSPPPGSDIFSPISDVIPAGAPGGVIGTNSIPPGGGGGGGGGGGVPPIGGNPTQPPNPPPPPPPPTAVPEPAQWLMLLTAFAFVGGAMRRRRRSHMPA
ncbi:PEPxxWA-CTERM sorting domain-containing protein [Sphingomonas sp. TDK1]|uniref:PEPxxWA-CTERM sorting domain-containing protein n=1 Tax=Sphingomonas sp. TDK1 TaxID=453247 RepID=UPI001E2B95AA|nr:PEPxxWA-CTERM sorting domain-containing protein [Sphingomonas sp. TDK1]